MRIIIATAKIPTPPSIISRLEPEVTAGKTTCKTTAIAALANTPETAPPYTHLSPLRILAALRVVTRAITMRRASTPSRKRINIASKAL